MKVGLLYSRIRQDEKLLLSELRSRGHEVKKIDIRDEQFDIADPPTAVSNVDVVFDRCLATSRSYYTTQFLEAHDIPVINSAETADVCADKVKNSLALQSAGIPTPRTEVSFTTDSAMESIERFGYPCVLKPVIGSWGRLMAKIESRSAAEAILEHKSTLGNYEHKVFYIQEFVPKPGRDIRVLAADGKPIAAMTRAADHWLTNAAKGAEASSFSLDDRARKLVADASAAVGGGLLGVDLMETGNGDYTVHEVNHTVEFKALNSAVNTDVPGEVIDWLETDVDTSGNTTNRENTGEMIGDAEAT
ncbi:lysine biosynthesis protein LysX [Haloquadratum walsbyi]|jgi:L-2-aminoadipate N-acetyltransferase (EC 2.3.1.-)|uniref:Lysine biosynthesis enzyme LysX n=1 Tax=Haloquadratum walsbyi J07HQW2 TaxID=1238425 RepID=U1NFP1_9EURY|nr:lysine biosynthesis protein LysX [Haloquadratum walsbyi]ERG95895.1 MAG: Lysine biosynthesis enzyme LysX [Haloquadratum walsbyi J07HQW2]